MPTYEYSCQTCRATFDVLQRISDPPLAACPKCNSIEIKRCFSAPTIHTSRKTALPRLPAIPTPGSDSLIIDGSIPPEFNHPLFNGYAFGVLDDKKRKDKGARD